jgi:hypothetical protein
MSAFEKPSEPATVQSSDVEPSQQTADTSDTVTKPVTSVATAREIEEWR